MAWFQPVTRLINVFILAVALGELVVGGNYIHRIKDYFGAGYAPAIAAALAYAIFQLLTIFPLLVSLAVSASFALSIYAFNSAFSFAVAVAVTVKRWSSQSYCDVEQSPVGPSHCRDVYKTNIAFLWILFGFNFIACLLLGLAVTQHNSRVRGTQNPSGWSTRLSDILPKPEHEQVPEKKEQA